MKIDIYTNSFVNSHGREPKGSGRWAFYVYDLSNRKLVGDPILAPLMTFTKAKAWVREYARANFPDDIATGYFALSLGA